MDIGAVFLILAVVILVGMIVSRPFTNRVPDQAAAPAPTGADQYTRSNRLAEYDRQLNALQELDFDHRLGKIPDEDYPQQRQALLNDATETLRDLDASGVQIPGALPQDDAERRDSVTPPPSAEADRDLEALIAARRRARQEKAGGFCPTCGKPVQESDRFCPKCGARLSQP
jgi:hypothetical protein